VVGHLLGVVEEDLGQPRFSFTSLSIFPLKRRWNSLQEALQFGGLMRRFEAEVIERMEASAGEMRCNRRFNL